MLLASPSEAELVRMIRFELERALETAGGLPERLRLTFLGDHYRLAGRDALDRRLRREVARWVLFLGTDLEYEWPVLPAPLRVAWFLLSFATLGLAGRIARKLQESDDDGLWPFRRRSDFEAALRRNPFRVDQPHRAAGFSGAM